MIENKTKTERFTDVAGLLLDVHDCLSVPKYLRVKSYELYITIWLIIIPKPRVI